MYDEVIFDVETKKLFSDIESNDPADLGVSIVSLYHRKLNQSLRETEGQMFSFWEDDFAKMWPYFQNADRIIGFNSLKFDVPALQAYYDFSLSKLNHFDILENFRQVAGHRVSLAVLTRDNLSDDKIDSGVNAVYYWNKKDKESLEKLKKYCEADVKITKDLYDFVLSNKSLQYTDKWNRRQKIELDFSYPKKNESQIGLF